MSGLPDTDGVGRADIRNLIQDTGAKKRARFVVRLISALDVGTTVLDVGCGIGDLLEAIEHQNCFGLEMLPEAARIAAKKAPVAQTDISVSGLPIRDSSVDVLFMTEVLEHLFDPLSAVREVSRVLRSGTGRAVFSVPNEYRLVQRLRMLAGRPTSNPLKEGGHVKFFSRNQFTSLLRAGGLRVERVASLGLVSLGSIGGVLVRIAPGLLGRWFFAVCEHAG